MRRWGAAGGEVPVVLLHAALHSSGVWAVVGPELGRDRLVVAPDLRGHGRNHGVKGYGPEEVARDVVEVVERLPTPPLVVGHSYGAVVAAEVARLTGTAGVLMAEPPLRLSDGVARRALEDATALLDLSREELVEVMAERLDHDDRRVAAALADAILAADPAAARAMVDAAAATGDLADRLHTLDVPWRVLRADPAVSRIDEKDTRALGPARVVVMTGCGASVPHDAPGRFVAQVRAFSAGPPR